MIKDELDKIYRLHGDKIIAKSKKTLIQKITDFLTNKTYGRTQSIQ